MDINSKQMGAGTEGKMVPSSCCDLAQVDILLLLYLFSECERETVEIHRFLPSVSKLLHSRKTPRERIFPNIKGRPVPSSVCLSGLFFPIQVNFAVYTCYCLFQWLSRVTYSGPCASG